MRNVSFMLLPLALAWSSAAACAEPPKISVIDATKLKIRVIEVASVESTTILTSEQIAKIPVPRNLGAYDCWGTGARQMKRECRGNLPIEECPVSASWTGL